MKLYCWSFLLLLVKAAEFVKEDAAVLNEITSLDAADDSAAAVNEIEPLLAGTDEVNPEQCISVDPSASIQMPEGLSNIVNEVESLMIFTVNNCADDVLIHKVTELKRRIDVFVKSESLRLTSGEKEELNEFETKLLEETLGILKTYMEAKWSSR